MTADCSRTYTTSELADAVDSAEGGFASADLDSFTFGEKAMRQRLRCVVEPLAPDVLARIHTIEALRAFLARDDAGTADALAGMAAADPGHQLPLKLIPDGHPVRAAMARASLLIRDPIGVPVAQMETGWIEVDGVHRADVPTNRNTVLQRFDADGQIVQTRYVHVGSSLAGWVLSEQSSEAPRSGSEEPAEIEMPGPRWRAHGTLAGAGAALSDAPDTEPPPGFAGAGVLLGGGISLEGGTMGGFAALELLGWTGGVAVDEVKLSGNAVVVLGASFRAGPLVLGLGPAWQFGLVHLDRVDCPPDACAEVTAAAANGLVAAPGGVLDVGVDLGESTWSIVVQGGGFYNGVRPFGYGAAGVRVATAGANR